MTYFWLKNSIHYFDDVLLRIWFSRRHSGEGCLDVLAIKIVIFQVKNFLPQILQCLIHLVSDMLPCFISLFKGAFAGRVPW